MAVANKLDKLLPIAKRVLRYLKGAADVGLIYPIMKRTDLIVSGVVDSDFAGDTTKKSTYCRYTYLDRCLINFTTKLQKTVATSTCNAEFNGIAEAMTDVIYYRACTAELKGKFWPKELSPFTVNYPLCDCPRAKKKAQPAAICTTPSIQNTARAARYCVQIPKLALEDGEGQRRRTQTPHP